jgi:N-acetylglucosaminyl-diphospho-decaprenol L-rhamnosyltransferase
MLESSETAHPLDLSVITIGTNQRRLVDACLRSVYAQQTSTRYEVIVVDNASTDGTAEMVQADYARARLVRNTRRLGYAANNNLGIRLAKGRYPMILNPDVEVLPGAFDALAGFMDANPDVGLAGPKLLNADRTLQLSCRRFSTPTHLAIRGLRLDRMTTRWKVMRDAVYQDWDHNSVRDVDYITGACMVARREMLSDVGLLDEGFVLYFEDQDWCYRTWGRGWRVTYVPQAVMIHDHQRASARGLFSKSTRTHLISMVRFFRKHYLPFPLRIRSQSVLLPLTVHQGARCAQLAEGGSTDRGAIVQ